MAAASDVKSRASSLRLVVMRERRRLSRAQSVLGCLAIALDQSPEAIELAGEERPDFADVANVARAMVNETIDRLDEVDVARARIARPGHSPAR